jgi:MerR family transcriptional regulator, light-induced transcriptional regulator
MAAERDIGGAFGAVRDARRGRRRFDGAQAMQGRSEDGLRPIGRVVEELTASYPDVTPSSLRFLEREGLIAPTRTPGGHRLYTAADIERVRRIKAWQAQRLSLAEIRQRLASLSALSPPSELASEFVHRAAAGDLAAAARVVLRADELGMPLARLFQDVMAAALHRVGDLWECGDLVVGQEKEISELARDLIAELSLRHASPDPTGPIVVAACVEGERHDLGLRMACALLRERGWRVHFLGADVAPDFLLEALAIYAPALVLLAATLDARWPALQATLAAIDARGSEAPAAVVIGGQIARDRAASLVGHDRVIAVADRLDLIADGSIVDRLRANRTTAR